MKLWQKNSNDTAEVDRFTVGRDREMDMYLAQADVLGSLVEYGQMPEEETMKLAVAMAYAEPKRFWNL